MTYLTAEQAKQKADNSDSKYKLLRHEVFTNIECVAVQGKYKLEVDKNTTYTLAARLAKELREYGYSVSYHMISSIDNKEEVRFGISWKY